MVWRYVIMIVRIHVMHALFRYLEELIAKEAAAGVPSNKIVVAGFSQGGAVALLMLRSTHKLAGIVGEHSIQTCV